MLRAGVTFPDPRRRRLNLEAEDLGQTLRHLLASQRLGVLSTQAGGQPYASLVAYAEAADLRDLVFATTRSTRKFGNITEEPRIAMLVDDRSNRVTDFHGATAATATGRAAEVDGRERDALLAVYLAKHPYMEDFVTAPTCALVRIAVDTYFVVTRFQNVVKLHIRP